MQTTENLVEMILNDYDSFVSIHSKDSDIEISEGDFSRANLENANFTNVDFSGSTFQESNLTNVNFTDCDLTSVDFSRAVLTECNFSGAILNGAGFNYATVSYCNFSDADMAGCNLSEADLSDSDFSTSENLDSCRFDESTVWPDVDKLPEDCQLLSADIIIAHQTAGAMYFAVGDQVWMHEVSSRQTAAEREYQVADFNGEEITYLRHVNRTQSDLDHLIVFTYDGENWKMYALPFIGGGAEIDASGNLDNYLVGTGKGRVNYCTRLIGNYEY